MHFDNGDPTKASPVPGGLHTGNIGQFDESIGGDLCAEAPSFRLASFEIGKFPAADRVHKKIVRLAIQGLGRMRKVATELLKLRNIHQRSLHDCQQTWPLGVRVANARRRLPARRAERSLHQRHRLTRLHFLGGSDDARARYLFG